MTSKNRFLGSANVKSAPSSFGPEPRFTMLRYVSKLPATSVRHRYPRSIDPLNTGSVDGTGDWASCANSGAMLARISTVLISGDSGLCGCHGSSGDRSYSSDSEAIANHERKAVQ